MLPTVSVVIPCYNCSATIERCLTSILAGTIQPIEIIAVDDASTDQAGCKLDELERSFGPMFRVIHRQVNGGAGAARNAGAAAARGDWVFFVDSDTELLPDTIEKLLNRIADSTADAIVGIYDSYSLNSGLAPNYKALLNNFFFSRQGFVAYEVFDAARAAARRSFFITVGGFNENLQRGMDYENEDLGYRMIKMGKLVLDPAIRVRHEFPNFLTASRLYVRRVIFWVLIFLDRRRFESAGITQKETGLSTLSVLGMTISLISLPFVPHALILFCLFLLFYLWGYGGFLIHVLRSRPKFFIVALILNLYFCLLISLSAGYAFLLYLGGRRVAYPE